MTVPTQASPPTIHLRRLLELPIDILYQTLQWLTPRDAVELSNTLPELTSFLSSPDANTVWIKLLREANAPQRPNGISYLKWADLLFGALICENCRNRDTLPNFFLMRRICQDCLDKPHNIVISREPVPKDKGLQSPLRDMVFYYTSKHYGGGSGPTVRLYWKADWEEIKSRLVEFNSKVLAAADGDDTETKNALTKFIEERKSLVLLVSNQVVEMQPWVSELARKNAANKVEQKLIFARLLRSRCLDAGYDPRDVQSVAPKLVALATPKGTVTDSDWSRLLPRITSTLTSAKYQRLERERTMLILARRGAIADLYTSVARTLPAEQWAALPGAEYVMGVGVFRELINDKYVTCEGEGPSGGLDIDNPKFAHLKLRERMESEIKGWGVRRRQRVLKVVRAGINEEEKHRKNANQERKEKEKENRGTTTQGEDAEMQNKASSESKLTKKDAPPRAEMQLEDLDLATTVLESPSPSSPPLPIARASRSALTPTLRSSTKLTKVYISWSDIVPVLRRDGDDLLRGGFQWSPRGSVAIKVILSLLNTGIHTGLGGEKALRVETAQPKDLDQLDARIQCMDCPEGAGRAVMTWRECVHHFVNTSSHSHPNFHILSPSDTTTVKQREDSVALAKTFLWTCNRCTHFFPDFVEKGLVLEHLQAKHGISSPVVGVDVVLQYVGIRPKDAIVILPPAQEASSPTPSTPEGLS